VQPCCVYLPLSVNSGLVQGEASVETTAGIKQGRIRDVELCIKGRERLIVLELTEVDYPLLGVTPWKFWPEPDLKNRVAGMLMNS